MFNCCRLTFVLAFTLSVGSSSLASAQAEYRWSADGTVGAATVNSGEFLNDVGKAVAHLAVGDRVMQRGPFAAYAEVGYDWLGKFFLIGANSDLICVVDRPGGGCRPDFPNVSGPTVSMGLLYAPFPRVETRLGVGGAAYSVAGSRVGAAVPATNVGLILGARFAVIPGFRHDRLTMVPVLLGLRVR